MVDACNRLNFRERLLEKTNAFKAGAELERLFAIKPPGKTSALQLRLGRLHEKENFSKTFKTNPLLCIIKASRSWSDLKKLANRLGINAQKSRVLSLDSVDRIIFA